MKKTLAYSITAGLFIIPIIPLIVTNSLFFPFITGKAFTFRIVVEIVTALWLMLMLVDKDKEFYPKKSWISLAVVVFVIITFIADLFAFNSGKAFWSNYERMEGWITILHLALYFFVAGAVLTQVKAWKSYFNAFLIVSAILCIYAFFQKIGKLQIHQGGTRLDATLGNSAYLAVYMLISFFLSVYMFLRAHKNTTLKVLYGILAVAELWVLYYTGTRGSVLGLIGGLIVWAVLTVIFERKNKKIRMGAAAALAVVILVVGVFEASKNTQFVKNSPVLSRMAAITWSDAAPRLAIWNMALQGFKEKPILGWGQDNFNYVFNKYYDPSMYAQEQWFDRAHNVFFDWLIAGGILGLLSYLSLFVVLFYFIWKRKDNIFNFNEKAVFTALLVSYFVHNLFVFDNLASYILFFTLLAFFYAEYSKVPVIHKTIKIHKDIQNLVVLPLIAIICLVVVYEINIKPMNASAVLIQALNTQLSKDPAAPLTYYKKALAYNGFGHQEIREQLTTTAEQVVASNVSDETKEQYFNFTGDEMKKELAGNPNDARENVFMGAFLDRFGLYDPALVYLQKAADLSPKKQTILFELGSNYIAAQKYDDALQVFKKAYELEPQFNDARIYYALAALYDGKQSLAEQILGNDKNLLDTDSRFFSAYAATKNYQKLLTIYQQKIKENPKDSQAHVSLAAVYLAMGNRQAAINQIQIVIDQNPGFKEQGTYYINEIKAGRNP